MNSKRCKRLRRLALDMTQGQPMVEYGHREVVVKRYTLIGLPSNVRKQIRYLTYSCTRGVYQRMKTNYKCVNKIPRLYHV